MNTLQKGLALVILFTIATLLLDLNLTRGHFLSRICPMAQMGEIAEGDLNLEYRIQSGENGTFKFQITNKSISPKFIMLYRDDNLFFHLQDSILFDYALHAKLNFPYKEQEQSYGFDCGTGLGVASINPFETFSQERSYASLLRSYSFIKDLTIVTDSGICDPIYAQPLVTIDGGNEWTWNPTSPLSKKDSVAVQFYLPVYSVFSRKLHKIYSNPVRLAYLDLIKAQKPHWD